MDAELFGLATEAALRISTSGIGTLSEKKVHSALKYYVQPDKTLHEVKVSGYVSDAISNDGVFEIQTRGFYRLKKKLKTLLKSGTVTVVYPIISRKKLYVTDIDTGELITKTSPKHMSKYDVFGELYSIRKFITSENFRLRLITMEAEEHRLVMTSVSKSGKKKVRTLSSETVPTVLCDDITLTYTSDYKVFLPVLSRDTFTSADFAAACKINRSLSTVTLSILSDLKVVKRIEKIGNAYVYKKNQD